MTLSRNEAETILIAAAGGTRPLVGEVLAMTDEGLRWVNLAELTEIQTGEADKDE